LMMIGMHPIIELIIFKVSTWSAHQSQGWAKIINGIAYGMTMTRVIIYILQY
jgi:hypothetical protein